MSEKDKFTLRRACRARLVPRGTKVLLSEGVEFFAWRARGGEYEVFGLFGAALIDAADAAGIGIPGVAAKLCSPVQPPAGADCGAPENAPEEAGAGVSQDDLWSVAKTVYDPEIPVNIVDLGLVYSMEIKSEDGKNKVFVDMTLTAPGCALGPVIANDLKEKIESLPSVAEAVVNIVWDPPWNQDMMSQEARMTLGLL